MTMAADVVAHQIARTPQQLDERICERTGVQSPEEGDVLSDGVPTHTSHFGTLTTDGTEVATEIAVAVVAMLHLALVPVSKVRNAFLPLAEALVIFF